MPPEKPFLGKEKLRIGLAVAAIFLSVSTDVGAADVVDDPQLNITASGIAASLGSFFSTILNTAESIGQQIAGAVTANGNQNRIAAAQIAQQQEDDSIAQQTEPPVDPCNTSASTYLAAGASFTASTASGLRPGGTSTADQNLNKAINSPAPPIEIAREFSAVIHTGAYCTATEVKFGYKGCTTSQMPDGDADANSLTIGAGLPGKVPDATFSNAQIDAARAFVKLSTDPSPPQALGPHDESTPQGQIYLGLQKAYQAGMSAATDILNQVLADHIPFSGSQQLINDILAGNGSAATYLTNTESPQAKATGELSLGEIRDFEAGRRARNPNWVVDIGGTADQTKLMREMVYISADLLDSQNHLAHELEQTNILLAEISASQTRQLRPEIEAQLGRLRGSQAN